MRAATFVARTLIAVVVLAVPRAHAAADPPRSWDRSGLANLASLPRHDLPKVDVGALLAEDEANRDRKDVPLRIGFPMRVDVSPATSGVWEDLPGGDRVWRHVVHSKDALWTVVGFDRFRLQPGGVLHVYTPDRGHVFGPATHADVREHGELWFPPLPGDTAVLELYWPGSLREEKPSLHLGTVSHGYKTWYRSEQDLGGDGLLESGACNIDVNCALGATWQDEKRGVIRLLSGGSSFCSASLITNTASDCRNYVLTANHCSAGASTTFQFNYERPSCGSGTAPTADQLTGAFVRASSATSDFTLLEMDDPIPPSYDVFYNGWSRSTTPATSSIVIHHPDGDVKKISYNDDPLTNDSGCGGATHWRVNDYEQGTTEPGSSGSPLFDQNHRIVGQLHCGPASCSTLSYDAYGKLDLSWTGGGTPSTRLVNWLDGGSTGAVTADGIDATFCVTPQPRLERQGHAIDDSAGNGDGIADPGDTVRVSVTLWNDGTLGATSVAGTLSTSTPLVVVTDAQATWPDIASEQAQTSNAPHFTLALDPAFPCGSPIALHLDATAAEAPGSWSADFTIATGTAQTTTAFSDNMESGTNGWTVTTPSGANPWAQVTTDSTSPTHSWKATDIATVSETTLVSPTIPALPANATLRFQHRFNVENDTTAFDGGVLEYSANGGPWTDTDALITQNGYTGTLSTSYANPLGGRRAWSGNSAGWLEVRVNLASLAGASVQLRWRFGTDSSVSDEGWFVDDVVIDRTTLSCAPPLAVPWEASDPDGPGAPFTIGKDPGGFALAWSAPPGGPGPTEYRLYRSPLLAAGPWTPVCEGDLGGGTTSVLASLPDDQGFVVVAANAVGEGSYGEDSSGTARDKASGGEICP